MRINQKIYLDHQATCPLDPRVFEDMAPHWTDSVGNPHSSEHTFGWQAASAVELAAAQVSALIGADTDEIFFTSGATESNNLALKGIRSADRRKVIASGIEHKCVLETLRHLHAEGIIDLCIVGVDSRGRVDLEALASEADTRTHTISIIGVHNEIGTVQNIDRISSIARNVGARLHLDLAQAATSINLLGMAQKADTISLSAHKFYGPMGIGCLYIKRDLQSEFTPMLHGGGQQRGLRSGTVPVPLCVGMGSAAALLHDSTNREAEFASMRDLNRYFWDCLQQMPFEVVLNGPPVDERHPGNLNVSFVGFDAQDIIGAVQPRLAISSGSACTSGIPEPSYVIKALGVSGDRLCSAIRLSIGRETTTPDIDDAVAILGEALSRLRDI